MYIFNAVIIVLIDQHALHLNLRKKAADNPKSNKTAEQEFSCSREAMHEAKVIK